MILTAKMLEHYAALPYRIGAEGLEILLVTSRESKRWLLPKGRPEKKLKPFKVAALEAWEEAGVKGRIDREPLGQFHSFKRVGPLGERPVLITVYALAVLSEANTWPEQRERSREWMCPAEAARRVVEPELADLLRLFAP